MSTLNQVWHSLHPGSLFAFSANANDGVLSPLWRLAIGPLLQFPIWLVLGLLGLVLGMIASRAERRRSNAGPLMPASLPGAAGMFMLGAGSCFMLVDTLPRASSEVALAFTSIGDVWMLNAPVGFAGLKALVSGISPPLWDPVLVYLLRLPAAPTLAALGLVLTARSSSDQALPRDASGTAIAGPSAARAKPPPPPKPGTELRHALASTRYAFGGIALFSAMSNLLMLTGAFFMLQVYDRVLPSRSVPTLVALSILAGALFLAQGALDLIRGRILSRIGMSLDEALSARVYEAIVRLPLKSPGQTDGLQPMRDLDSIRGFLSGQGPSAFFDLPWLPIYLGIIFAFHPVLGLTALIGAIILIALTILTEAMTREPTATATKWARSRLGLAEGHRRNAQALAAMGMVRRMGERWSEANRGFMGASRRIGDVAVDLGSLSRSFRLLLQSAVLAVGAYFVIRGEASAGIIIAGSILVSRALAPVDLAIANWKSFVAARQSWTRLNKLLEGLPVEEVQVELPPPRSSLSVEGLSAGPPGRQKLAFHDVSFKLAAGQGLGIIGPSASGKSTLARLMVGVWQQARGRVRLDGADLSQWSQEALGRHVGYLPQDVELFAGTIAENIARFDPSATSEEIIAAARLAGVHDLILSLQDGYDFQLGEQGQHLSAGQLQRVALARALFRDPFLVVLDEPNSNLDAEGEAALTKAILSVRARGGIVVVIAHRRTALAGVDQVLMLANGRAVAFGPRDEVLAKVLQQQQSAPQTTAPLKIVTGQGGG